jgi:hypothetical protein
VAKLQVYKFVNSGSVSTKDPLVAAARSQTLAFNRMGSTLTSIGTVISDIEKISIAQVKDAKKREQLERRRDRRQKDTASEEIQESTKSRGKAANLGGKIKNSAKKGLGWIDKFLGPIATTFVKLASFAITTKVLEWLADDQNTEKLKTFLDRTKFVFEKIFGWAKGFTENILDGFGALADPNGSFLSRLGGLGKIMMGIIGLKYLMNPFSLISDILGLVDILGRRGDRPPRVDKSKKVTQRPTANKPSVRPTVKPSPKLSPFQLEQARKVATKESLEGTGEQVGKKATGQVFKYGGKNITKATHRFFLKVIGRGGVTGLKKLIGAFKLPLISGLLTAALNWIMGESIAKSLMMGVGDGIGTFLGGWAGGAIGALGGPAAPITIPLGAFVGAMLGGIAGEAIGGYLYDLMLGKANLGADLGAMGKKLISGMKSLWNDYIMNGDFWAGAWETFLNIGQDVMSSAWGSMMNMWNYASGAAADFFTHMMEVSKPWREAMWDAFQKYVVNGPQELVKVIFDTILSGAKGIGQIFAEGAPILMSIIKTSAEAAIDWAFNKVKGLVEGIRDAVVGFRPREALSKLGSLLVMLGAPLSQIPEMMKAVGAATSKTISQAIAKSKEIGQMIIDPIMGYIDPAIRAINETWKIVSNLPGYVYDNTIKPIFDAIGSVWNSGPAIWEFLHRPNTFQEITGQEVPQQEMFLGGVVKGIGNAVKGVSNAVSGVMQSPVGQVLGTAASFIPGAAPIMAGINTLATGNPMSMLGMIPGMGAMMNSPLGQIGSQLLGGNFTGALSTGMNMVPGMGQFSGLASGAIGGLMSGSLSPTRLISNVAEKFNMGGLYKAVTGAMGGDYTSSIRELGSQIGVNPSVLGAVESTTSRAMSKDGLSAEYAMQQALEFVPVPMILERLVPLPTAVPINTGGGGGVVTGVPSSITQRTQ